MTGNEKVSYFLDSNLIRNNSLNLMIKHLGNLDGDVMTIPEIFHEVYPKNIIIRYYYKFLFFLKSRVNFRILRFCKIYKYYQRSCPLYYNFISNMLRPAHINSEYFVSEYLNTKKARNGGLLEDDFNLKNNINNKVEKLYRRFINKEDDNDLKTIWNAEYKGFKKKNKAKDEEIINDIKLLSASLVYSIIFNRNVVLVSSDSDQIFNLFNLITGLSQEISFRKIIKGKTTSDQLYGLKIGDVENILIEIDLDYYYQIFSNIFLSILGKDRDSCKTLSVKFWSKKLNKYIQSPRLNVTKEFVSLCGGLWCPTSQNINDDSWIGYKYEPLFDNKKIKIIVRSTQIITKAEHISITEFAKKYIDYKHLSFINKDNLNHHDIICQYRINDKKNNWEYFYQFSE